MGEPGGRSDRVGELADTSECHPLRREPLRRHRRAVAEGPEPVAEQAMLGGGWSWGCESGVVIGVMVNRRRGRVLVVIVGRVPAAQRARQDKDNRERDERRRAKSQRSYHGSTPGQRENVPITG